ncbi:hypothetical protein DFQ29_003010 [Apophysomyces sp. BC1021]|nr:hypothetical protein DFQ29_003010 [Apophysomyces sp. BC1021]
MRHITPPLTYAAAIILVMWLLLGAITLPNATRWFQGSAATLQQERVVLPINSTSMNKATEYEDWQVNKNIYTSDNTPMAPKEGLRGILYDRGLSCETTPVRNIVALPSNVTKIALIRRGDCPFTHKLLLAQLDGASAVVVYNNISFDNDPYASYGMAVKPQTIYIPAYYIDLSVGLELREALVNASIISTDGEMTTFVRITLFPPRPSMLEPWKLALGITGLVLTACFVAAGTAQCHYWWKTYRQTYGFRHSNSSDDHPYHHRRHRGDRRRQHRTFSETLEEQMIEDGYWRTIADNPHPMIPRSLHQSRLNPAFLSLLPLRTADQKETNSCVICLEEYNPGEAIRCLPCEHEYHQNCIGTCMAYQKTRYVSLMSSRDQDHRGTGGGTPNGGSLD